MKKKIGVICLMAVLGAGLIILNHVKKQENYEKELSVVRPAPKYSYEQMQKDLHTLENRYPQELTLDTIGFSEEGREIPVAIAGNPSASHQILVQGAIHAREYGTTLLIMSQLDYMLTNQEKQYNGQTIASILDSTCFHIIPMANPDGVHISQIETLSEAQLAIYESDQAQGYTALSPSDYAQQWKANSQGIDLNRSFDAGWYDYTGRPTPSSERYKGPTPEHAPEAQALADYTRTHPLTATLSYHESGSVLYYNYGSNTHTNDLSRQLAEKISQITAYPLAETESPDAAGYKDWAIDSLQLPSLTIETGQTPSPVTFEEFPDLYTRNRDVLLTTAQWTP